MRRALVNDLIHSFCYCCRTGETTFPCIILDNRSCAGYDPDVIFEQQELTAYVCYLFSKQKNYITGIRLLTLLASYLCSFSQQERMYAASIMERYYGS